MYRLRIIYQLQQICWKHWQKAVPIEMYNLEVCKDTSLQWDITYPAIDHRTQHPEGTTTKSTLIVRGQHYSLAPDHLVNGHVWHHVEGNARTSTLEDKEIFFISTDVLSYKIHCKLTTKCTVWSCFQHFTRFFNK